MRKKIKKQDCVELILKSIDLEVLDRNKCALSLRLLPFIFSTPRSKSRAEVSDLFIQHSTVSQFSSVF